MLQASLRVKQHRYRFNHVELLPFHTQILIGVDKLADIMLGLISRFDCNNIVINKCLEIYHVLADKFALEPLKEIQYEDIIEAKLNEVVGALCRAKLSGSDVAFENDLLEILT